MWIFGLKGLTCLNATKIVSAKCLYSYLDELHENLVKTTALEWKKVHFRLTFVYNPYSALLGRCFHVMNHHPVSSDLPSGMPLVQTPARTTLRVFK